MSFTRRVLLIKLNTTLLGLVPGGSYLPGEGPFLNSSPGGCSPEEPVPSSACSGPRRELVWKQLQPYKAKPDLQSPFTPGNFLPSHTQSSWVSLGISCTNEGVRGARCKGEGTCASPPAGACAVACKMEIVQRKT